MSDNKSNNKNEKATSWLKGMIDASLLLQSFLRYKNTTEALNSGIDDDSKLLTVINKLSPEDVALISNPEEYEKIKNEIKQFNNFLSNKTIEYNNKETELKEQLAQLKNAIYESGAEIMKLKTEKAKLETDKAKLAKKIQQRVVDNKIEIINARLKVIEEEQKNLIEKQAIDKNTLATTQEKYSEYVKSGIKIDINSENKMIAMLHGSVLQVIDGQRQISMADGLTTINFPNTEIEKDAAYSNQPPIEVPSFDVIVNDAKISMNKDKHLKEAQLSVFSKMLSNMDKEDFSVFLLWIQTAGGKTWLASIISGEIAANQEDLETILKAYKSHEKKAVIYNKDYNNILNNIEEEAKQTISLHVSNASHFNIG